MRMMGFHDHSVYEVSSIIDWVKSEDQWESQKQQFKHETNRLDTLRNENFVATFPELADLMFV